MFPRQQLVSVPYAVRAGVADHADTAGDALSLGGFSSENFVQASEAEDFLTAAELLETLESLGFEPEIAWADILGIPADLADGDADTLSTLFCAAGEVAKWDGLTWSCDTDIDTHLSEAEVDAFVANNGYALETALSTAVASLEGGDDILQTNVDTVQTNVDAVQGNLTALSNSLDPVATAGLPPDLLDGDDNSDVLASLVCGLDQVARWDGSGWQCSNTGDRVATAAPGDCDAAGEGKVYFDSVSKTLRICDGVAYRGLKICDEICGDAATVVCGLPVEDDCGTACGPLGTAFNTLQCAEGNTVECGVAIADDCGNDCGYAGSKLTPSQCSAESTACGSSVVDDCGNECGGVGEFCADGLCVDGVCTVYASCKELLDDGQSTGDGTYSIRPDGLGSFDVYCDMTTDGGGWTLIMMMKGDDVSTFRYDSAYWDNSDVLNELTTDPDVDTNMKNRAYNSLGFSSIRMDMATLGNSHTVDISRGSAHELFTGPHVDTSYQRQDFLDWIPVDGSKWDNQPNCNLKGFQLSASQTNCRYGISMNNEGDCTSNDASIGFGCHTNSFFPNRTTQCGGSRWTPDEAYPQRGWIFVR
ncbi:MAG: hypothetical protein CMH54_08455 [Myxococcales bacterium]|nr:hypothetical protein [Myxococcales bacterium]